MSQIRLRLDFEETSVIVSHIARFPSNVYDTHIYSSHGQAAQETTDSSYAGQAHQFDYPSVHTYTRLVIIHVGSRVIDRWSAGFWT